MEVRLGRWILSLAAAVCIWDAITAPRGIDSETILILVLVFLLLRGAYSAASASVTTVLGGCVGVAIVVAGDRGLLDGNKPVWIVVMMLGFLFFGLGDRIEKWLR